VNIGRRIYYEVETGIVLWDKGEMSGNVFETTVEEDINTNPALQNKNIDYIDLAYGERSEEFKNIGSMKIVDGKLVIYPKFNIEIVDSFIKVSTQDNCLVKFHFNSHLVEVQTINKEAIVEIPSGSFYVLVFTELYGSFITML
jgi:hypothetical protein